LLTSKVPSSILRLFAAKKQKRESHGHQVPGVDFLEFDSLLTDDERLVRDTARKFIETI